MAGYHSAGSEGAESYRVHAHLPWAGAVLAGCHLHPSTARPCLPNSLRPQTPMGGGERTGEVTSGHVPRSPRDTCVFQAHMGRGVPTPSGVGLGF